MVAVLLGRVLGSMQGLHPLAIPARLPGAVDEADVQRSSRNLGDLRARHILRLTLSLHTRLFHMGRRRGEVSK